MKGPTLIYLENKYFLGRNLSCTKHSFCLKILIIHTYTRDKKYKRVLWPGLLFLYQEHQIQIIDAILSFVINGVGYKLTILKRFRFVYAV